MNQHPILRVLAFASLAAWLVACAPETPQDAEAEAETEETAEAAEATPEPTPAPAQAAAPKPRPAPAPQPTVCSDCGRVAAITPVQVKGDGSGAGAVAGAVAGGVAGHQVGGGRGKDLATAAGVIIGAMAGHEIEKRARSNTVYDVTINMDGGGQRVVRVIDPAGISVGTPVIVDGNNIRLR